MTKRSASVALAWALLAGLLASSPADAQRRPRILLSDDDGISAAGLLALYPELARLGEVTVAAPADNQSGVGHGITYADPILLREIEPLAKAETRQGRWYRIVARPATCVRLALSTLLAERPDLVVSGINRGDNVGLVVYMSGTVGAAREAAFDGIPSIAASQEIGPGMDYRAGAAFVGRLAAEVLRRGVPHGTFINVNIPAGQIKGVKVVPHAMTAGVNTYEKRVSPRGDTYFWNAWTEPAAPGLDTDVGAVRGGYVAVTPLGIEVNAAANARTELEGWNLK
jgi:5'-nucleotidase